MVRYPHIANENVKENCQEGNDVLDIIQPPVVEDESHLRRTGYHLRNFLYGKRLLLLDETVFLYTCLILPQVHRGRESFLLRGSINVVNEGTRQYGYHSGL
jgi:hypothetical protein